MLGRLQAWLQGTPTKQRPYVVDRGRFATVLGNRISDLRFFIWRMGHPL
jgi:hypothetical protein